jgi:hypothetical protein
MLETRYDEAERQMVHLDAHCFRVSHEFLDETIARLCLPLGIFVRCFRQLDRGGTAPASADEHPRLRAS